MRNNPRKYKIYKKYGLWVAIAGLIIAYLFKLKIIHGENLLLGLLSIYPAYEAITALLTGRLWTRGSDIVANENPISYWVQVIFLTLFSVMLIAIALLY